MSYIFTSESVSNGHPDKVADAISDSVATYLIDQNINNRAAVETLVTTNMVTLAGEYKSDKFDKNVIDQIVRDVVKRIGYEQDGFHWRDLKIYNELHGQSSDIALGTDDFGAGDQGLMFGYATRETSNYMPLAISLSHKILREVTSKLPYGPDAKAQVSVEYSEVGKPLRVTKVVCSAQHGEDQDIEVVRSNIVAVISSSLSAWVDDNTEYLINPTGNFVIGGPDGDAGVTGRKIIVDTYGGYCPHGGGAFSGKDCTKVDRSGAYMARYLAKNLVHFKGFDNCTVQLSYAIGVKEPTSIYVYADGKVWEHLVSEIRETVDLTPKGIIDRFDLFGLDLTKTTNYGHFGKPDMPWERLDLYKS
jgi:S-adenosylmethionine synthetase